MAFMVLWTMTKERNKISPIHIPEVLAITRTIMVVNGKFFVFVFSAGHDALSKIKMILVLSDTFICSFTNFQTVISIIT